MSITSPITPPAAARRRLEGRVLGRYRLLTHVADGGMASVHLARAEGTFGFERLVAIKLLHAHLAAETEFVTMIADEARMAACIRHPKVVSVLDVDEDEELGLYLVMDYVEGDHLGNVLHEVRAIGERVPPRIVVRIVLDLLEGLGAAHELVDSRGQRTPIIHRDVSPHNVLVGIDGIARLADFGVAHAEARITQTRDGRFKGKVAYMAPEQLADGVVSARADLFAVGVLLWESLTGRRLFRGDTTAETLKRLLQDLIPRVDAELPELAGLADVVAIALSRDPEERFESAAAMARALADAAVATTGIAEARDVGELVRGARGAMLAERNARMRDAAGVVPSSVDVTTVARMRPSIGDRTPTRSGRSRIDVRATLAQADRTPAPPSRARRSIAIGAFVAAFVGVAAFARVHGAFGSEPPARRAVAPGTVAAALADASPVLEHHVDPVIAADRSSIAPTVVLRVKVGTDGSVLEATPYQAREDRATLERIAIAACRDYRFRPAIEGGRAVEAWVNVPVQFRRASGADHVVRIKGSDTIGAALGPALADRFRTLRPDIDVSIESLGSSTAFVGLFDGSADLGTSSRPIARREADEAERLGIDVVETVIGYDGVAIVVHPDNPIASLTLDQLADVFSGRVRSFAELGGDAIPIHLLGRPSYSGTHAYFESRVLAPRSREFTTSIHELERSDELVAAVAGDPSAIAYVGTASLGAAVRILAVSENGVPVLPSESTIRDGSYPIARPLLVYSRGAPRAASAELLRFVLSPAGRSVVREAGFVPSDAALVVADGAGTPATESPIALARHIQFAGASTTLPSGADRVLAETARLVAGSPTSRVAISGHADTGSDESANVSLGEARARVVAEALHRLGVSRDRIVVESRGSSAPLVSNDDATGRARNRRVDVVLVGASP